MNEAESPSSLARHFASGWRDLGAPLSTLTPARPGLSPGAPLRSPVPPGPPSPLVLPRRMQISPLLAGGLLLALLSVRLEAKPASQLPQKVRLPLPRCSPGAAPPKSVLRVKGEMWGAPWGARQGPLSRGFFRC